MKLILSFLMLAIAPLAQAQSLWGNTSAGMSVDDFRHAYPEAVEINHEPTRRGGTSDYLQLQNINIADQSFTASFFFREHLLDTVVLQPNTKDPALMSALADTLRDALTQKYGAASGQREIHGDFANGKVWTWSKDGTTVSLELLSISKPISLQVRYDAKAARAANQL